MGAWCLHILHWGETELGQKASEEAASLLLPLDPWTWCSLGAMIRTINNKSRDAWLAASGLREQGHRRRHSLQHHCGWMQCEECCGRAQGCGTSTPWSAPHPGCHPCRHHCSSSHTLGTGTGPCRCGGMHVPATRHCWSLWRNLTTYLMICIYKRLHKPLAGIAAELSTILIRQRKQTQNSQPSWPGLFGSVTWFEVPLRAAPVLCNSLECSIWLRANVGVCPAAASGSFWASWSCK